MATLSFGIKYTKQEKVIEISKDAISELFRNLFESKKIDDTSPPKLIGISGKMGTGKDYVANLIKIMYPCYKIMPFAYNVKKVVSIITGTTIEDNIERKGKSSIPRGFNKTLATYQQIIGQGMRDLISQDVWINVIMKNVWPCKIIPDVRYLSELKAIEKEGGIIIRLERNEKDRLATIGNDGRDYVHSSETELDSYPFKIIIYNHGTLEELNEAVRVALTLNPAPSDNN